MVMVPLEAEAVGLFAKWGAKLAMAAAAAVFCIGLGAYGMHKWDAGTISDLKASVSAFKTAKSIDDGTIAGLRAGINTRNKQAEADAKEYADKMKALQDQVNAANVAASDAQRRANALLSNKPRPGQDVIASGVDQVEESIP